MEPEIKSLSACGGGDLEEASLGEDLGEAINLLFN
jgi:hypothetical protein